MDDLREALAGWYLRAAADPLRYGDCRAYAFHGARLGIGGDPDRYVQLPDGTRVPIVPAPADPPAADATLLLPPAARR